MSLYTIAVFLHVVGALGLFAALGLEWAGILNIRRVVTSASAQQWAKLLGTSRRLGGPAALAILVTGIYMSETVWGRQAWIGLGFIGLLLIATLGAMVTDRRLNAITRAMPAQDSSIPLPLRRRLDDPVLRLSAWLRTALALGIVFLMSARPSAIVSLAVMAIALAIGLVAGLPAWSSAREAVAVGSGTTES